MALAALVVTFATHLAGGATVGIGLPFLGEKLIASWGEVEVWLARRRLAWSSCTGRKGSLAELAASVVVPTETAASGSGLVALLVEERALVAITA